MSTKNERREPYMTSSDTTSPILITGATGRHGGVPVLISHDGCAKRADRSGRWCADWTSAPRRSRPSAPRSSWATCTTG